MESRIPPASGNMITAGHGPSPTGMLRAAGQAPSAASISTMRCVTATPFLVPVLGPYRHQIPVPVRASGHDRCIVQVDADDPCDSAQIIVGSQEGCPVPARH